jgi:hypothetical protein
MTLGDNPMVFKKVSIERANDGIAPHVPKTWRNATMEHVTCVPGNPTMFHAVLNWNSTRTLEQVWNALKYIACRNTTLMVRLQLRQSSLSLESHPNNNELYCTLLIPLLSRVIVLDFV